MSKILKYIRSIFPINSQLSILYLQAFLLGSFISIYFIDSTTNFLFLHKVKIIPETYVAAGLAGIIIIQAFFLGEGAKIRKYRYFIQYGAILVSFASLFLLKLLTYYKFFLFFYFAGFLPFTILSLNTLTSVANNFKYPNPSMVISRYTELMVVAGVVTGGIIYLSILDHTSFPLEVFLFLVFIAISALQIVINKFLSFKEEPLPVKTVKTVINYFSDLPLKTTLLVTGLFILFSAICYSLIDYSFLYSLESIYTHPKSLSTFLTLFIITTMVLTFVFRLFVYQNLIKTFKFNKATIIAPAFSALALLTIGFMMMFPHRFTLTSPYSFLFLAILFTRIFAYLIRESFERNALNLNFVAQENLTKTKIDTNINTLFQFWAFLFSGMILLTLKAAEINNISHRLVINLLFALFWIYIAYWLNIKYAVTIKNFVNKLNLSNGTYKKGKSGLESEYEIGNISFLRYILNYQSYYQPHHFRKLIKQLPESLKLKLGISLNKNSFIETKANTLPNIKKNNGLSHSFFDATNSQKPNTIELLVESFLVEDRIDAIRLIIESKSNKYINLLKVLIRDPEDEVKRYSISAITKFQSPDLIYEVLEYISHEDYTDLVADVMVELGEIAVKPLIQLFNRPSTNLKTQVRIIKIIANIPSNDSNTFLLSKLDYPNKLIVLECVTALQKAEFKPKETDLPILSKAIETSVYNCSWLLNAVEILEKNNSSPEMVVCAQEEYDNTFDLLLMIMELQYGKAVIEFFKESVRGNTSNEQREFSVEILDFVIDESLKNKLFPLIHNNSRKERLNQLQNQFPLDTKTEEKALIDLINSDLGQIGIWTKSFAIVSYGNMKDVSNSEDVISQLYNPETILNESAVHAISLWKDMPDWEIRKRIPEKVIPKFSYLQHDRDLNKYHFITHKVQFLKKLQHFSNVKGESLLNLAEVMEGSILRKGEKISFQTGENEILPALATPYGEVLASDAEGTQKPLTPNHFYGLSVFVGALHLEALSDSFLYIIPPENLTSVILSNEDISEALFSYLKENKIQ